MQDNALSKQMITRYCHWDPKEISMGIYLHASFYHQHNILWKGDIMYCKVRNCSILLKIMIIKYQPVIDLYTHRGFLNLVTSMTPSSIFWYFTVIKLAKINTKTSFLVYYTITMVYSHLRYHTAWQIDYIWCLKI